MEIGVASTNKGSIQCWFVIDYTVFAAIIVFLAVIKVQAKRTHTDFKAESGKGGACQKCVGGAASLRSGA
eukprot:194757-Lingulodinium_polyedra.AAC.1